jgi:hypothetical protein
LCGGVDTQDGGDMSPFTTFIITMMVWTFLMAWRMLETPEFKWALAIMYVGGITMISVVYVTAIIEKKR